MNIGKRSIKRLFNKKNLLPTRTLSRKEENIKRHAGEEGQVYLGSQYRKEGKEENCLPMPIAKKKKKHARKITKRPGKKVYI